jgi:chemotaxis response regulator CheB
MTVFEAEDGMQVRAGHVYIAPGDRHLLVMRDGARWRCKLDDGEPVNRHKPSVRMTRWRVRRAAMPSVSSSPAWATTERAA